MHLRHGSAPSLPPEYCKVIDGAAIGLPGAPQSRVRPGPGDVLQLGTPARRFDDLAEDSRWGAAS